MINLREQRVAVALRIRLKIPPWLINDRELLKATEGTFSRSAVGLEIAISDFSAQLKAGIVAIKGVLRRRLSRSPKLRPYQSDLIDKLACRARNFPAAKLVLLSNPIYRKHLALTERQVGMRPELASGYSGQLSINTAARQAGRIELKNRIISYSQRGCILCHLLK